MKCFHRGRHLEADQWKWLLPCLIKYCKWLGVFLFKPFLSKCFFFWIFKILPLLLPSKGRGVFCSILQREEKRILLGLGRIVSLNVSDKACSFGQLFLVQNIEFRHRCDCLKSRFKKLFVCNIFFLFFKCQSQKIT